ncbi:HAMP domain-containing histidine kinase [Endozoicomonas sp. SM1973]|uniref:histidine kinase n=1 Tax=Spartinivicinus marinus TaxID=2994442 RepID=A0A853I795_9GAMM|nr:HAMP domain-containing sensor histidine kinase [Spartinivicinus marinus]MCX4029501.1 HAMP domain-containing sensor histidine kinase [Spartinivicinus marinus]NYZ65075.1 HAMP domain-containing histidine kinase [Spartinivicinus marinus]
MKKQKNIQPKTSIDMSMVLATCAHDIKNSLSMLIQSLDELSVHIPEDNKEAIDNYALLYYESSRINNDLTQLLSFYRLQDQQLIVNKQQLFLIDLIEEQIARNQYLFHYKGVQVGIQCDDNLSWYFDEYLIGCLINNVLVNAARYTKDKVLVLAQQQNNQLILQVHDNGNGFPNEMIACQKAPATLAAPHTGSTYLGLYFAQEIAQIHQQAEQQGSIKLSNDSLINGTGGCFTLYLP